MKYLSVTVTPELIADIHNVLADHEASTREHREISTWLGYVNQQLFEAWSALPEGDPLKAAYADQVWTWDDQDLYPENRD